MISNRGNIWPIATCLLLRTPAVGGFDSPRCWVTQDKSLAFWCIVASQGCVGRSRLQRMTHTAATIPISSYSQDCSSVEFVPKRELDADDLVLLAKIGFKPFPRTRLGWLKFRSLRPGAAPWHLDQAEADLLLSDLRKIIQFARLASQQKDLFERRAANELPFYPKEAVFTTPLRSEDLEWQKMVLGAEPPPKAISLSDSERAELDCSSTRQRSGH